MKKLLLSAIFGVIFTSTTFAQAPESFNYQAVIRDGSNLILNNQNVGLQFRILQGSTTGTAVYTETFAATTNAYGLVNLQIGTGTTVDDFTIIDWSAGPYFIETSADVTGGTSYTVMGTSQLISVPYALHSKTAETALTVTNDQVDDADADPTNEIQAISFSNDTLYLSNGGQVYLGAYAIDLVDDADNDPTNEIETWGTLAGIPSDFADDVDNVDDADADPANEIQILSFSNDTLYLSNGGQIYLGAYAIDLVDDADNDPTNEIETWATLSGIPSGFADDVDNVDDADNDPTNEIETWGTLAGIPAGFADNIDDVNDADSDPTNEIETWATLSGIPAGFADNVDNVDDADADATNELQTLSMNTTNGDLTISGGNTVGTRTGQYALSVSLGPSEDDIAYTNTFSGDDAFVDIALPFTVTYDGVGYTNVRASTNGWIEFGNSTSDSDLSNDALPTGVHSGPFVAAYWDDLRTTSGLHQVQGTAPNRTYVIYFNAEQWNSAANDIDFSISIHEGSGAIVVRYFNIAPAMCGQGATIGFQAAGGSASKALPISCNAAILDDNLDDTDPANQTWSVTPVQ